MHHTVEIENLTFTYPDGRQALRDVSLRVGPTEKVALVGPNGAGKSTLMLHLNGLLRPSAGQVEVGGLPVTDDNLGQIRAWVGLVFQNPDDQLFNPKVFDDVAFGPLHMDLPPDEVHRRSLAALEAVGMAGYADRISHHLSLGEKKRIAIATVLSMEPKILVLDEPTSGLDPRARRGLINLLCTMADTTMLAATHDMRLVEEFFPRMAILDEGQVVADGPTQVLLADAALLEAHGLERP
jgi:cobalt/nickel transport system ATP-binding protein